MLPGTIPGQAGPDTVQVNEDAEGDAVVFPLAYHRSNVGCPTVNEPPIIGDDPSSEVEATCSDAHAAVGQGDDRLRASGAYVGVPAPKNMDIIATTVTPADGGWWLGTTMAGVEGGIEQWVDHERGIGSGINYRFNSSAHPDCVMWTYFLTFPGHELDSALASVVMECRGNQTSADALGLPCARSCLLSTHVRITEGTPGSIEFWLPANMAKLFVPGETLSAFAVTYHQHWDPDVGNGVALDGTLRVDAISPFGFQNGYEVDRTGWGYFTPQRGPSQEPILGSPAIQDIDVGRPPQLEFPELDILALAFHETPSVLSIELDMGHISPNATDHAVNIDIDFQTGSRYRFGYAIEDGKISPYSISSYVDGPPIPYEFHVTEGTPGKAVFTVGREFFPAAGPAEPIRLLYAITYLVDIDQSSVGNAETISYGTLRLGDISDLLGTVNLQYQTEGTVSKTYRIPDHPNDVSTPVELNLVPFDADAFDIQYADLYSDHHDHISSSIALRTVQPLEVPAGYDAAFRGIALQLDQGDVLVGHYQQSGFGAGEFFCATDTLGFQDVPRDPILLSERWERVQGRIEAAESRTVDDNDLASQGTRISMSIPKSCLGLTGDDLTAEMMDARAATYLFRNPSGRPGQGEAVLLDDAQALESFAVDFAERPITPTSAWAEPFGITNFWDIFGVLIAVGIAVVSLAVVVRKRVRMKRYLVQLEDLADHHHDHPEQYAIELVALRKRLYGDLLSNRLTEGHFVMVEERLRSALSGTRINAFGRSFYALPPALMIRLQSLLADGRFSPHDHRVLSDLVGTLRISTANRTDVRNQLDLWASQDAEVARLSKERKERRRRWLRAIQNRLANNG